MPAHHPTGQRRSRGGIALLVVALGLVGCSNPLGWGARGPDPVDPADPGAWASHALDPCALLDAPGVRTVLQPTGPSHLIRPHECVTDYRGPDGRRGRLLLELGDEIPPGTEWRAPVPLAGLTAHQVRARPNFEAEEPTCHVSVLLSEKRAIRVRAADAGGDDDAACAIPRDVAREVAQQLSDPVALVRRALANPLTRWEACDLVAALPEVSDLNASGASHDECSADLGFWAGRSILVAVEFGPEPGTEPMYADVLPGVQGGDEAVELVELPSGPIEQAYAEIDSVGPACAVTFTAHRVPGAAPAHAVGRMSAVVTDRDDACGLARKAADDIRALLAGPAPELPPVPTRLGVPFR